MKMRTFKVHIEKVTVNGLMKEEIDYQKTFYYNEKRTNDQLIDFLYYDAVDKFDLDGSDKVEITLTK